MNHYQIDVAPFIRKEVMTGLQILTALNLGNTPTGDLVAATANAWLFALQKRCKTWNVEQDTGRITHAFQELASQAKWWPTPAMLIDFIPARKPLDQIEYKHQFTREELNRNKANLSKIKHSINQILNIKRNCHEQH